MADFIIGRGVLFGFFLLLFPAVFLYHELAVQHAMPILMANFPGVYPETGKDTLMFVGNAILLPAAAVWQGISLMRMHGSRILGVFLVLAALALSVAIFLNRPALPQ